MVGVFNRGEAKNLAAHSILIELSELRFQSVAQMDPYGG